MNIKIFLDLAAAGDAASQALAGICYLDGIDVAIDYSEAFRLLSSASMKGLPRAMSNLARMYHGGLGTPKDISEALRFYRAAANAGEFMAQVALGRIYSSGTDLPISSNEALTWYSKALNQEGRVYACEELEEARNYVHSTRS